MALPFRRSLDLEHSSLAQDAEEHLIGGDGGRLSAGGVYPRPKTVEREAPAALSGSPIGPPALPVLT